MTPLILSLLTAGAAVSVPAGQGTVVKPGRAPEAPKVLDWTAALNWNMDPAKGALQDKTRHLHDGRDEFTSPD